MDINTVHSLRVPLSIKAQFPNNSGKSVHGRWLKAVVNKTFQYNAAITVLRNISLDKIGCNVSIVKPTRCTNVSKLFYFWNDTLHVSEGLSVHQQEFKTVHTARGICQTDTAVCLLVGTR